MRITGGFLRGRPLLSPKDEVIRPTADKTRLAVFNMLESRGLVRDSIVLDAFCGTGALALEAISRGAAQATLIDSASSSLNLARKNASSLQIADQCHFLLQDSGVPLFRPASYSAATLVFLDPPYRQELIFPAMTALIAGGFVATSAVFVVETEKEWAEKWPDFCTVESRKIYGQSAVFLVKYHVEGET